MATPPYPVRARRSALQVRFARLRRENTGLAFVLPSIVTMAAVIGYPVAYTFFLSVSKFELGVDQTPFVGLANFAAVFDDRVFLTAVRNTLIWTVLCVAFIILLGLLAALLVNESFRGRSATRSLLLLPWIIPGIVAAVLWKWLYHPDFGIGIQFLVTIGVLPSPTNLLANPNIALYAVILVNIWKSAPFAMLMLLAGLQSAPPGLYDAARVDGAGIWGRFRYVTLPHLRPVILVVALLMTIWNMNTFTYIYVLTGGGPIRLTEVLGVYIYNMAFQSFKFDIASAAAVIVFIISTGMSLIYLRVLRAGEE